MSQPAADSLSPPIEVIHSDFPRGRFLAAIFDFDGTLSLLRRNWQNVMIPMMVDILAATGTPETKAQLYEHVEEFVMRLNGRQTIYQMLQLCEEVAKRGGSPLDPLDYKRQYYDLMREQVSQRVDSVRSGRLPRDLMMVPGSEQLLQRLRRLGLQLYLASGTDEPFVREESAVLGLDVYFGPRIYGALDDYERFSKGMLIEQICHDTGVPGRRLLGFGDGFVEIEEIKKVGGLAVGVASNEDTREGVNLWKRRRLIRAGADLIVGDYRNQDALFSLIELDEIAV